jgi:hypothetical protein
MAKMKQFKDAPVFPDSLNQYATWVARYGLYEPYGKCQCGCGQLTPISDVTRRSKGYIAGEPVRFAYGHQYRPSLEKRFWDKVSKTEPDECWLWTGSLSSGYGYGRMANRGVVFLAHRLSYEINIGPIPEEMIVCHHCDNPACVNPSHLFLGTYSDNSRDMTEKGRQSRGKHRHNARLAAQDVREIRRRYVPRKVTQQKLAEEFGVSRETIRSVIGRTNWSYID